nr:DUF4179 domain-containing protein [uncultured Acetatifactor sp.]
MTENKVWNEMEVPMELDSVIIDAVGEGHKRLMRRQQKRRLRAAGLSMAMAAACFLAVAVGFVNPVVAKAYSSIPVIGNIFAYLYDTAESDIPYAQVGEAAVPVKEQEEAKQGQESQGQANQPNQGNPEQQEGLAAGAEAEAEDPVQIAIKEYFCDGYSLYLSFEVTSEEPLMEGVADIAGKEGGIFLYATENITTDANERFGIGAASLTMKGIFTDEHTFVGIARSGGSLDGYPVTDEMLYEMSSSHMRIFVEETERDIRGDWKVSAEITRSKEPLLTAELGQTIREDFLLKEVAVQPYELQVVIEGPKGRPLTEEYIWIEAFDDKGRRLSWAAQSCNRHVEEEDALLDIYMFEKPMDAEKVTVFALDELKWMDEWKGYLYCDEPWSGEQMIEFLKENCFTYGEVELPQSN